MDRLIYTAMSGANAAASRQSVLANNLANVSTNGFRAELSTYRAVPLQGEGATTRVFAVEATAGHLSRPGAAHRTDRAMDVMANGNAWFAIQGLDGTEAYTRNGELGADSTGLLKTRSGQIVVGESGPLTVPENTKVSVAPDGTVTGTALDNPTQKVEIGKIKLVNPPVAQMEKGNDGLFRLRNGQPAQADEKVKLVSGALEGSNVNSVDELVSMISAQRHYDLQLKMISNADQNARSAAQLISLNG